MIQPSPQLPGQRDVAVPATSSGGGKAIGSLCLGRFSLIAWLLPMIGLPTTITGLVLGIKSLKGPRRGMATAGIVLCTIGLVASIANAAIGAYLGATGRLHH